MVAYALFLCAIPLPYVAARAALRVGPCKPEAACSLVGFAKGDAGLSLMQAKTAFGRRSGASPAAWKDVLSASQNVRRCNGGWERDPIIIGGVSDSGTRGARLVVRDGFNVTMCPTSNVNDDDTIVMDAIGTFWKLLGPTIDANGRGDTGDHEEIRDTLLGPEELESSALALCDAIVKTWKNAGKPQYNWGFKVPRTITSVALFQKLLPDHKFIHVTRDPRTMCTPFPNKISFRRMGEAMGMNALDTSAFFLYWGKQNLYASNFYDEIGGGTTRYLQLAAEDLVGAGPHGDLRQRCLFDALKAFLGAGPPEVGLREMMAKERTYVNSYLMKALPQLYQQGWAVAMEDPDFQVAMKRLGYSLQDTGGRMVTARCAATI